MEVAVAAYIAGLVVLNQSNVADIMRHRWYAGTLTYYQAKTYYVELKQYKRKQE